MDKALRLTTSLIENRDAMRRILGYARTHQLELAVAALDIGRRMDAANVDPSLIFAAFVDECEAGA